jgi:hypothetical protein
MAEKAREEASGEGLAMVEAFPTVSLLYSRESHLEVSFNASRGVVTKR